jgi:Zn finger protein HypA/HybF involved in hydrogenase expression
MHEFAIAEEIVAATLRAAAPHRGRLERVHVVVGENNHLDPDILGDAFTMAAAGTEAAGADLNLEVAPHLCEQCADDPPDLDAALAVTAIEVGG